MRDFPDESFGTRRFPTRFPDASAHSPRLWLAAGQYRPLARCSGHSSYVTHVDWSCHDPRDPERRILQSTDGAYEFLYWDGNTGSNVRESMRDEKWDTYTCPLGFNVMGIWPHSKPGEGHADGTDVNAVCRGGLNEDLLVTADDSGLLKLFNYPCVVEHAPYRGVDEDGISQGYVGHSSHVTNIRFSGDGKRVVRCSRNQRASGAGS